MERISVGRLIFITIVCFSILVPMGVFANSIHQDFETTEISETEFASRIQVKTADPAQTLAHITYVPVIGDGAITHTYNVTISDYDTVSETFTTDTPLDWVSSGGVSTLAYVTEYKILWNDYRLLTDYYVHIPELELVTPQEDTIEWENALISTAYEAGNWPPALPYKMVIFALISGLILVIFLLICLN